MKVLSVEFGFIVLGLIMAYIIYDQKSEIEELKETIYIQDQAIKKQKFLLELQSFRMGLIEPGNYN
jgi:hypothetical protein